MTIEIVNSPAFAQTYDRFHFSQAVKAGGLLFCSGVVGTGADGKVPGDLDREFRNAFEGVKSALGEAGLNMADVVEMTTYHVDMEDTMPAFFQVRDEYLAAPWSAWTAIGISALAMPGAHVEIRVVAKLD